MNLFNHKKTKEYRLDANSANDMLQNVFAACEKEPNTIPFDKLLLKQKAKTKPYTVGKIICLICLLILWIVPLIFCYSNSHIQTEELTKTDLTILHHYVDDSEFVITLSGPLVDSINSFAVSSDGTVYEPSNYREEKNQISFPCPDNEELNLYIYEYNSHYLHLVLSTKE